MRTALGSRGFRQVSERSPMRRGLKFLGGNEASALAIMMHSVPKLFLPALWSRAEYRRGLFDEPLCYLAVAGHSDFLITLYRFTE
jgi:hypothetical protein